MLHEDMSIYQLLSTYPFLLEIFKKHGLGKFENREILEKLGPLLKLRTALHTLAINKELFIELLRERIHEEETQGGFTLSKEPERQRELTLLALLPCGMKMPFNRGFDEFAESYNQRHQKKLHYLVEGNVNHELSYYAYIDSVTTIEELPDIIISSDINSFYHQPFTRQFIEREYFIDLTHYPVQERFAEIGYPDPRHQFTMLSGNLLVVVGIDELTEGLPGPSSWGDLLGEAYTNSVVMRGQEEFFCNGVLLPFYALYGMEGIKHMARTVAQGVHPSQMVKMIDSRSKDVPPFYIMPYFFTQKIKYRDRVTLYVPREGAIVSPVQMLVKKTAYADVKEITDFLCGPSFGQLGADAYFPSINAEVENHMEGIDALYWLGWDFLTTNDIGSLKKEMEVIFREEFSLTGGRV